MSRYVVGIMTGLSSFSKDNPKRVIEAIRLGKKLGLDLLVGPEWSLMSAPDWKLKKIEDENRQLKKVELMRPHVRSQFSPRDAGVKLRDYINRELSLTYKSVGLSQYLERQRLGDIVTDYTDASPSFVEMFPAPYPAPYSPREAAKLINILEKETVGSRMLVVPGTMMVYTAGDNLYNVLPVISNGQLIKSCFKARDGGSTRFSLGHLKLKRTVDEVSGKQMHNPVFYFNNLKFGVEICADATYLSKTYGLLNEVSY